jgi:putative peptidoglycan lipid II flippase
MSRRRLLQAATVIAAATVLSKVLGFLREVALAARFGATSATDAYLVASLMPVLLVSVVGVALGVTVIPVLSECLRQRGREAAFRLASNLLTIVLLLSGGLAVLGEVLAPQLVRIVSPGFEGPVYHLAVKLTRIMLPAMVFHVVSGLLTGILQALDHFAAPALVGLPFNLLIIGSIVFLGPTMGIAGVAVGTLAAIASQVAVQWPVLRRHGFSYTPILDLQDPGVRKIGRLILPVLLGSSAAQIGLAVDRMLASGLVEGSISALNYAQKLSALPQGVVALAVSTVLYPKLSQAAAAKDWTGYRRALLTGIRLLTFLMLPMMVGLLVLREPIVRLLFERGAFDAHSTSATAFALFFFSLGLVTAAVGDLVAKAYFAVQDTATPLFVGIGAVAVNIGLNLLLIRPLAHGGLALGTSLASFFSLGIMLLLLRRRVQGIWQGGIGRSLLTSVTAAAAMGALVRLAYAATQPLFGTGFRGEALHLGIIIAVGGLVYCGVSWLAGSPEIRSGLELARAGWQKLTQR